VAEPARRPSGERPRPRGRLAEPARCAPVPRLPAGPSRAAAAYARLKRGLAERFGDDLAAYTDLKDSACDLIVVAAEAWDAAGRGEPAPGSSGPAGSSTSTSR
jgi:hypothetical protein